MLRTQRVFCFVLLLFHARSLPNSWMNADAGGGWDANTLTPVCWTSCQFCLTALSALTNDVIDGQNKRQSMSTHTYAHIHAHLTLQYAIMC